MKQNNLITAIFKSLLSMAGVFVLGFLGYHYPDAMVWVVTAAIFCALFYYFYRKDNDD